MGKCVCVVAGGGEGLAVVRVSRVSAGAPGGSEEDPQLSQHQQQSDQQARTVSTIVKSGDVKEQGLSNNYNF